MNDHVINCWYLSEPLTMEDIRQWELCALDHSYPPPGCCNDTTIAGTLHKPSLLYLQDKCIQPKGFTVGLCWISVRNVTNVRDSEWRVTNSMKNYKYLMTSAYSEVESVSDVKTDNCAPSGDRYDRTGHREDKCTGKYWV
ncbi:uncharacterized protein HD556DRAFT_1312045 [Suillus plorans]|uniref:Uncharacterized protein n=1 Tax=Suillus plorans TaxID=116603 RepID=A0A9P7AHJ0_9AGAM|nr:uncharacterized protein HD556DRAFT_1312045 [Suillus plorans]KAG1788457.1 hypothetical protein HD556DRAFT_1312045 [Suillus plorans]